MSSSQVAVSASPWAGSGRSRTARTRAIGHHVPPDSHILRRSAMGVEDVHQWAGEYVCCLRRRRLGVIGMAAAKSVGAVRARVVRVFTGNSDAVSLGEDVADHVL